MELRLVDPAHILPVQAGNATDDVRNGIALSPTYHRAFDAGLIYLDADYVMRADRQKELQLVTLKLEAGLAEFKRCLDERIHLPADKRQWPNPEFIRRANRYRQISA
jgi:putative restriction endonuclease